MQWQAKIRRQGFEPVSMTFTTQRDAEDWAKVTEAEMIRGVYISRGTSEKVLMEDLIKRYLREVTPSKKNAKSETEILGRISAKFGKLSLAALQPQQIASYRDELKAAGRAASTIAHYLNALSCVINKAMKEWGYPVASNPVRNVERPVQPQGRERRLLPGEEKRILRECRRYNNPVLGPLVRLALETAARQGELFGLLWEDVDQTKRVATLRDTKNKGESRTVPLSSEAIRVLDTLKLPAKSASSRPTGKVFGANIAATRIAFTRAVGRARNRYVAVCERAGVKPDHRYFVDLTFHDLRHEAASRLFERGLDGFKVASITGHKTMAMLKRYTHLRAEDLAKELG